jgi:hypothetical protein
MKFRISNYNKEKGLDHQAVSIFSSLVPKAKI